MSYLKKKFKNDGNPKIFLADKANFSFDFGLILAILSRFSPLCIVFSLITTATSCQDADFFSSMVPICMYVCVCLCVNVWTAVR